KRSASIFFTSCRPQRARRTRVSPRRASPVRPTRGTISGILRYICCPSSSIPLRKLPDISWHSATRCYRRLDRGRSNWAIGELCFHGERLVGKKHPHITQPEPHNTTSTRISCTHCASTCRRQVMSASCETAVRKCSSKQLDCGWT